MTPGAFLDRRRAFLLLLALALGVRLLFLFVALPLAPRLVPGFHSEPGMRFDGYHDIAVELLSGHGYALPRDGGPTAARAPLYPLFLAGLYRVFGAGTGVVLAAHALLGALACAATMLLGWRLYGRAVGLMAGLVLAFHPLHLWWSQYVLSETLLVLTIVAAALGLAAWAARPGPGRALGAGALLGLAMLCNSVSLLFPPVLLALAVLVGGPGRLRRLRGALLVACAAAAVVLPWSARNALRFRALIPVNTGLGFQTFKGWASYDHVRLRPHDNLAALDDEADLLAVDTLRALGYVHGTAHQQLGELRRTETLRQPEDAALARLAAARLRRDPGGALGKALLNLRLFWTLSIRRMEGVVALDVLLALLAAVGVAATAARDPARRTVAAYAATLYLAYASIIVSSRFSLQVIPIVAVFASAGLLGIVGRLRGRPRGA